MEMECNYETTVLSAFVLGLLRGSLKSHGNDTKEIQRNTTRT